MTNNNILKFFFLLLLSESILGIEINPPSDILGDDNEINVKYTPYGSDQLPDFKIHMENHNKVAQILFVIFDPNVPNSPEQFIHYAAYTNTIKEDFSTESIEYKMKNSWDQANYKGPTPPKGTHNYQFAVYALKKKQTHFSLEEIRNIIDGKNKNLISKAIYTAPYSKKSHDKMHRRLFRLRL